MAHEPPEIEIVPTWRVSCDGGGGASGHPLIWLTLSRETGRAECPYCGKVFIHVDFADQAG